PDNIRLVAKLLISLAIAPLTIALFNTSTFAAEEKYLPDGVSASELIDSYTEVAFFNEVTGEKHTLRKFPQDAVVDIVLVPQDSIFDTPGYVHELIALTANVAEKLNGALPKPALNALSANESIDFLFSFAPGGTPKTENWIMVIVGSVDELKNMMDLFETGLPGVFDILRQKVLPVIEARNDDDLNCFAQGFVAKSDGASLVSGLVFIQDNSFVEACLYEEVMQMFGLANDLPFGSPSIFNDDNVYDLPTPLDLAMWKLHFLPELKPGMELEQARTVILDLLSDTE
ncbi:hypothetical protein MNBD_ALPHA11-51, partial [hydrothermal vent metagenome]